MSKRYQYRPDIKLTKETGNIDALKHNIDVTLRRDGELPAAKEFREETKHMKNYDKVLEIAKEYTNVKDHNEK